MAGFALPFAFGVISAYMFFPTGNIGLNAAIPTSVCILIGLSTFSKTRHCNHASWAAVMTLSCLTGMACCQTGRIMAFSPGTANGILYTAASSLCESMKASIDSIPFADNGTSGIIKALLTGDRSSIPSETESAFRDSGASHILALSGMHLGIIYGIVKYLLAFCGNSPAAVKVRAIISVTTCGLYTMAVGAGDSITRAFLFILIREISSLMHRPSRLGTTLLASLVIQLAFRPTSISSISFQLSYAAMAGIAYIHPFLKDFWPEGRNGPMKRLWNTASLSISCQAVTGPLAWHHFKTFPKHFILTNMIAMPLTCIIIPSAILTVLLHSIEACPYIMIKATESLVTALTVALGIIASM